MASASAIKSGEAFIVLGVDMTALTAGLKQAQAKLNAWGQGAMQAGRGLFDLGLNMAKMLQPGVVAFADYEQALADLRAAAAPNEVQFEAIKNKIEEISKATGIMPVEVTQGFGELLKAGRTVEEVIGGMGETAIKFARVSGVPMAEAAVVMADALNVFSQDGLSAARVVNIMNQAADATTLSLQDVVNSFARGGSAAGAFDQTMMDTAVALAVMSEGAIKGVRAGTGLRILLSRLAKGTGEAGEGEGAGEVNTAMQALGLNAKNAEGKLLPLPELIRRINEGLQKLPVGDRSKVLFGLAGQYGAQAVIPLLKAGTAGFEEMRQKMEGSLTVEQKFAIMTDTLWGAFKKLWVHIQFVSIEIGAALAPALRTVGAIMMPVLNALQLYFKNNHQAVQMFAAGAAKTIAFGVAIYTLGLALSTVGAILAFIASTFGVFLIAVGAIGFAIYQISQVSAEPFEKFFAGVSSTFKEMWGGFLDAINSGEIGLAMEIVALGIEMIWKKTINFLITQWNTFASSLTAATDRLEVLQKRNNAFMRAQNIEGLTIQQAEEAREFAFRAHQLNPEQSYDELLANRINATLRANAERAGEEIPPPVTVTNGVVSSGLIFTLQDRMTLGVAGVGGNAGDPEMNRLQARLDNLRADAAWWKMYNDTLKNLTPEEAARSGIGGLNPFSDVTPKPDVPGDHRFSVGTFSASAIGGMLGGGGPIDKLRGVAERQLDELVGVRRAVEGGLQWA